MKEIKCKLVQNLIKYNYIKHIYIKHTATFSFALIYMILYMVHAGTYSTVSGTASLISFIGYVLSIKGLGTMWIYHII
jgi:hypothetical protein